MNQALDQPIHRPLLTASLPGTGGAPQLLDDFRVEEIPAYLPEGAGEHCLALVEKRGLTTPQAITRICQALHLAPSDAGYAGLKDKAGVTQQWISFAQARPNDLLGLQLPELRILEAALHRNKIHTGHLKGNRFAIVLRDVQPQALERSQEILAVLAHQGLPNYYGPQRFGRARDNAEQGLRLLRGEGKGVRDKRQRRLLISALQSHIFNEVLAARLTGPGLDRLLGGEVLQRTDSGGLFVSEDLETDSARLARQEVVITGPICGPRMPLPKEGSAARQLEQDIFARLGLEPASFASLGRLGRGGRRALTVKVEQVSVELLEHGPALQLRFTLPAGSYATVLLEELTKSAVPLPEPRP